MKNQNLVFQESDLEKTENTACERNVNRSELQEIPDYCDLTQEMKKNPKKIIEHDSLKQQTRMMFQNLGRTLVDSINICGVMGSGKTTIVEYLTQKIIKNECPKEFENTSVIQVLPNIFTPCDTAENIAYNLTMILADLNNKGIKKIIMFFDDFNQFPYAFLKLFESIKNALKNSFDFELLKFIMIIPKDFFNDNENQGLSFFTSSVFFETGTLLDFELAKKILKPRVKEISEKHGGIEFSSDMLEYILLMMYSKTDAATINLTKFIYLVDFACAICKQRNSKVFEEEDFKQLFFSDFQSRKNTSKDKLYSIAYHEAGHCVLALNFSKEDVELVGAKSLYDDCTGFSGTTMITVKLAMMQCSKWTVKRLIAFYLAGRNAEKIWGNPSDCGAVSDLKKAMDIAKNFVYTSGTSKALGKNCLYAVEDESTVISDETCKLAEDECKHLIKKANKYCKKILLENKEFLDTLAEAIYKKGILSQREILKLWENYKKKCKRASMQETAKMLLD